MIPKSNIDNKKIILWLISLSIMVIIMVIIGGITRLTHSGLSIVEWNPITGIIPPTSEQKWLAEFHKYQQSPEYLQLNFGMTIKEFKFIFWLEYIHRLMGRLTGIVFILPFLHFYYRKSLNNNTIITFVFILILGVIQGFVGWYMVKSGLYNEPHISPFRLSMHLLMAFLIFSLIFWQALNFIMDYNYYSSHKMDINSLNYLIRLSIITLIIVTLQITFGSLVAGFKAGYIYNNFPFMGSELVAPEVFANNYSIKNFLNNPASLQFTHRILAFISLFFAIILIVNLKKYSSIKSLNRGGNLFISLLVLQIITGIITLISVVDISYASIHQVNSIILFGNLLYIIHFLSHFKKFQLFPIN